MSDWLSYRRLPQIEKVELYQRWYRVYPPHKTKDGRPETVRVPLNDTAKAILEKYKDCEGDRLLPFIIGAEIQHINQTHLQGCGVEAYRYGAECENGSGVEADLVRGGIVAYCATNLYRQLV